VVCCSWTATGDPFRTGSRVRESDARAGVLGAEGVASVGEPGLAVTCEVAPISLNDAKKIRK
jgi:hypothetical protein